MVKIQESTEEVKEDDESGGGCGTFVNADANDVSQPGENVLELKKSKHTNLNLLIPSLGGNISHLIILTILFLF